MQRNILLCVVLLGLLPNASALTWKTINPPLAPNELVVYATQNPAAAPVPGAVANGVTDNTSAFQNAMNILHAGGGGVLYVPAGHYAFYGNLTIPTGVTIHGDYQDWSTGTNGAAGTVFKVYGSAGQASGQPFIFLNGSTGLRGVTIWHPNQNPASITPYPFAIGLYGDCVIMDVALVNPYQGIEVNPTNNGGAKHIFSSVVGSPLFKGINIDGIYDISHLEDIRFSPDVWATSKLTNSPATNGPHATWMRTNGTALRILKVDGEICMDTWFSGYKVGIESDRGTVDSGPPGACFYGGGVTNCGIAYRCLNVAGQGGFLFTKFVLDGDTAISAPSNNAVYSQFHSCEINGRSGPAVLLTGNNDTRMQFQNCTFNGTLQLNGGHFSIVNSRLNVPQGSNHLVMGASAGRAAFVGCDFSPTNRAIVNPGSANKVLVDYRDPIPNPLPQVSWAAIKQDYLSRKPAKTNLYVVTDALWGAVASDGGDDTAAINKALTAAGTNNGGIVFLPGGKYKLTNSLVVPKGVELRGTYEGRHRTWPSQSDNIAKGSILQPTGGQGTTNGPPAIILQTNSGLLGVTISYETQNSTAIPFPPAIQGRGGNVYVIGVVCPNPYYYVDLDTFTCTNHLIYMVDGWALKTGYKVGNGSSGSIVDCHGNWTYWWDNYDSASILGGGAPRNAMMNYCQRNLEMYVLGDCTELLIKNFVIPGKTFLRCVSQNGKGTNATFISPMADQCIDGMRFESAAPSSIDLVNSTLAIFADGGVNSDLTNNTVGALSTSNFLGLARFYNVALFARPVWDFIVGGGDFRLELVHMLDHAYNGSRVDGGTLHMVNNSPYIAFSGSPANFPVYQVLFGAGAGTAGAVSEVIGCSTASGISIVNNSSSPILAWGNFPLSSTPAYATVNVTPPQLNLARTGATASLLWPTNGGAFNLLGATSLTAPTWTVTTNSQLFTNGQWAVTLPLPASGNQFLRLRQP